MPVQAVQNHIAQQAQAYQDTLTKPAGSLGRLEDIACWFAARQNKVRPDPINPHITIFAADHGICEEGISAFPSIVTGEMVKNFAAGGAAINVLAKQADASLSVVDVGVLVDTSNIPHVIQAKTQNGTANSLLQPAMSKEACLAAIQAGKNQATEAIQKGANLLIAGDMGIGNTTTSAVLIALLTHSSASTIVGLGTGVDEKTYQHKVHIVEQIISRLRQQDTLPEFYLEQAGGFEIAAISGYYLEAARQGIPIVIDGFISTAAALVAKQVEPDVTEWMLASHVSQERGHQIALDHLGIQALLDFQLRLGEGSGAALILPLLQSAIALHRDMATFESAEVSDK